MALLLFVRSAADILPAVEAASEFLSYQQRRPEATRDADKLLAICIDPALDALLPAACVSCVEPSRDDPEPIPFRLKQSFSHAGIWTLCWIDLSMRGRGLDMDSQRESIIGMLVEALSVRDPSRKAGVFIPVFGAGDSIERIEAAIRSLNHRYPELIGATWFVHDQRQGKIVQGAGGTRNGPG